MQRREQQVSEFKEKMVAVNRVTKVVKGGRNFRFSALMVVGDEKGRVGVGMGKAAEIPEAIRKGIEDAKKDLIQVPIDGTTIPHEAIGTFGKGRAPAPGAGRHGRDRGQRCARRDRGVRHQGHPHQVCGHEQPDQHGACDDRGIEAASLRGTGCGASRQDRGRAVGLRGLEQ